MRYSEARAFAREIRRNTKGHPYHKVRTRIRPIGYLRRTKGFVGQPGWKVQIKTVHEWVDVIR